MKFPYHFVNLNWISVTYRNNDKLYKNGNLESPTVIRVSLHLFYCDFVFCIGIHMV
jgi:hypothetical protein